MVCLRGSVTAKFNLHVDEYSKLGESDRKCYADEQSVQTGGWVGGRAAEPKTALSTKYRYYL